MEEEEEEVVCKLCMRGRERKRGESEVLLPLQSNPLLLTFPAIVAECLPCNVRTPDFDVVVVVVEWASQLRESEILVSACVLIFSPFEQHEKEGTGDLAVFALQQQRANKTSKAAAPSSSSSSS